ncbi:MAG: SGNH/GDSL hydrolase family protein [Clostridiales bacterium]|nr:SGNH/GDSL hydrolase family protein [Clostridiales bacterium]
MMMRWIAALLCCLLALGIASAETEEETGFTRKMLERSLVSVGNTERIQRAIEKAKRGEQVTIAYLGGSITEGAQAQPQATKCYAYLSAQRFADLFMPDPSQLNYVNAGISGTPSVLGITRLEQDVLSKRPDIVFVEFAVNDSNQPLYQGVYESMVRKLIASETQPAVILIFTFTENGYSCQPHMQQVGKHYGLGMVSVRDAVQTQIILGKMKWSDYSGDYTHPNTAGHAFIADAIGYYFEQAAATAAAEPYEMPVEARYGKAFETLKNVREGDAAIVSAGSFAYMPDRCYSYDWGWKHLPAAGNKPLTLQLECSRLIVAFKQEKTGRGACEVWVDGKLVKTLPGSADNAWGNIVTEIIPLGEESAMHTIEFRIAAKDVLRTFTVLDVGYVP